MQNVQTKSFDRGGSDTLLVPPKNIDPALATVIRRLRLEQGISQETLARKADMSTGSYAKVERGKTGPAWVTVRAIAKGFGLTPVELVALAEEEER
jgi:transcriptional regulator with XRE-family HTH domain